MDASKDLSKCSPGEIKTFMDSFDDVLLDCDGVIFNMENLIPGVKESIACLRKHNKKIKVITNNCMRVKENWEEMFQKHNLACTAEDVIYPTNLAVDYLREIKFTKKAFILGPAAVSTIIAEAGFEIFDYQEKAVNSIPEAIELLTEEPSIGAVIIDWDMYLTYMKWMKAAAVLTNPDVLFICLGHDKFIPLPTRVNAIGPYFTCTALEFVTGRTAMKISKPYPMYSSHLQKKYRLKPNRTLFVGDTLEYDMAFAADNGYQKLMVLTGVTKLEDLKTCNDRVKPKYYLKSLGEFYKIV